MYFLELLLEITIFEKLNIESEINLLIKEENELVSIFVSSIKTARNNNPK